jgi:hypothetical protein
VKQILMAACIAAVPAFAHGQATQPASATTAAPATTPPTADPVEMKAEGSGVTFRVGGFMVNGERNYAFNNTVGSATGSLKGVEVLLRGGGVGLSFRSLTGSFSTPNSSCASCSNGGTQPDVTSADASVLIGPPAFTVFLGASKRALTDTSLGVTQVYTFGRVGAQMSFLIGGSGFSAQIGGWGYIPQSADAMKIGGEGEGSIIYTMPKIPIFLQVGYRTEVFTSKTLTTQTPEEVRGLRLGGGIQFGGK